MCVTFSKNSSSFSLMYHRDHCKADLSLLFWQFWCLGTHFPNSCVGEIPWIGLKIVECLCSSFIFKHLNRNVIRNSRFKWLFVKWTWLLTQFIWNQLDCLIASLQNPKGVFASCVFLRNTYLWLRDKVKRVSLFGNIHFHFCVCMV